VACSSGTTGSSAPNSGAASVTLASASKDPTATMGSVMMSFSPSNLARTPSVSQLSGRRRSFLNLAHRPPWWGARRWRVARRGCPPAPSPDPCGTPAARSPPRPAPPRPASTPPPARSPRTPAPPPVRGSYSPPETDTHQHQSCSLSQRASVHGQRTLGVYLWYWDLQWRGVPACHDDDAELLPCPSHGRNARKEGLLALVRMRSTAGGSRS